MSDQPTDVAEPLSLRPDVLIVGGGVMGLWLLNELRKRQYYALLLERRELGGEQTCHSHVYIHEGHLYRAAQASLSQHLHTVHSLWDDWLATHHVARGFEESCFGFKSPAAADDKVALWSKLNLPAREADAPAALAGGAIVRTFYTGERCLIGESLVNCLRDDVDEFITRADRVDEITVEQGADGRKVTAVRATLDGTQMMFRPRALVLTAGSGNQALLDLIGAGRRPLAGVLRDAQQLRLAHMLILRGATGALEPLTGIFPDSGGLFLVSRVLDGEVVWLVSDNRSPPISFADEWLEHDARSWLPRVLLELRGIAPSQLAPDRLGKLLWGLYAAPKAERRITGVLPDQEQIEQFQIENLWAVWPTKLTLAPKASQALADAVERILIGPSGAGPPAAWTSFRRPPATARERWRLTPLVSWDDFRRCYGIDYL